MGSETTGLKNHLLSANIMIDNILLANAPLWMVSLDSSKAFEREDWRSLCTSPRLISFPQMTYANQKGQVMNNTDTTHEFDICAGVRQGCVLSRRLFCSVLQLAMGRWRNQVEHFISIWETGCRI